MTCIFCDFSSKQKDCFKVWEDDSFLAFLDINPINPGHTLLIPKDHIANVFDMNNDAYIELFEAIRFLSPKIKKALNAPKVGMAIEGFGVGHAHVHLVPVYKGNELNPERAQPASAEDLELIRDKIVSEL